MPLLIAVGFLPFFLAIGTFALFFCILKYKISVQVARRKVEMAQIALERNLRVSDDNQLDLKAELKAFDLFDRNFIFKNDKITNILTGSDGFTNIYLFDYTYIVSNGKASKRITQTVFFAKNNQWSLPNFKLRPEGWWQKLMQFFGKKDINFEEHPDFSQKWWLTGEFESMIRERFSPEIQDFLQDTPPMHVEGNNYYLIAYKPKTEMNAEDGVVFYDKCRHLMSLLEQKSDRAALLNLAEIRESIKIEQP